MRPVAPAISARYELIEPLGATALTTTYVVRDLVSGDRRVVKVPRAVILESKAPLEKFREVAERVRHLDDPHLLPIYEVGSEGDQVWVISPFEEGPSVRGLLISGMPLGQALALVGQVAEGLETAHKAGIVHGNIRPGNVFWHGTSTALLSDFGEVFLAEGVHPLLRESLPTPLPAYLAPELAHSPSPTNASDVYALGCLLYELATGQPPFLGTAPATVFAKQSVEGILIPTRLNPALPPEVEGAILKALAFRPSERYASAAEMARALKETLAGLTPTEAGLLVPPVLRRAEGPSPSTLRRLPAAEPAPAPLPLQEERRADGFVACPVCHLINPASMGFCSRCWYDLSGLPLLTPQEARKEEGRYRRRVLVRRGVRYSLPAVGVLLAVWWLLSQQPPPGQGLAPPTSTLSAISGEGEWVSYARDPQGTSSVSTSFPVPTGQVQWKVDLGSPLTSSPVVARERVFMATSDNRLLALDRSSGSRLWEYAASGPLQASPVIAGDLLFMGQQDGNLVALGIEGGEEVWRARLGEPVLRSVTVMDGVVYSVGLNGTLFAHDAATGGARWSLPLGLSLRTPAVISDGLLALGSVEGNIYVLDAQTGEVRLDYLLPRAVEGGLAIDPERGVVYVGSNYRTVNAVDLHARLKPAEHSINFWWSQLFLWGYAPQPVQSGTVWQSKVGGLVQSPPALAHGLVIVGTENGKVVALDARSGGERWRFTAGDAVRAPIAVVNQVVFAGSVNGNLYALDAETGKEIWRFTTGGGISGGPAFAQGLLFLPSQDGTLYALK